MKICVKFTGILITALLALSCFSKSDDTSSLKKASENTAILETLSIKSNGAFMRLRIDKTFNRNKQVENSHELNEIVKDINNSLASSKLQTDARVRTFNKENGNVKIKLIGQLIDSSGKPISEEITLSVYYTNDPDVLPGDIYGGSILRYQNSIYFLLYRGGYHNTHVNINHMDIGLLEKKMLSNTKEDVIAPLGEFDIDFPDFSSGTVATIENDKLVIQIRGGFNNLSVNGKKLPSDRALTPVFSYDLKEKQWKDERASALLSHVSWTKLNTENDCANTAK